MLDGTPWNSLIVFKELSRQLKQKHPLPDYTTKIAEGTADYEAYIRIEWQHFKENPTIENAQNFISALINYVENHWQEYMADVLGIDSDDLSLAQLDLLKTEADKHIQYMKTSLLPDLLHAIKIGLSNFNEFDYRVIFLYAGALWSFGFLATIMFDGLQPRDAGDIFLFLGPDDDATCTGDRGCKQHVNKAYTVAEILVDDIIPGRLKCLTSCRHILIPVVSM